MQPILHNYFRSSTSHRVRTALALKGRLVKKLEL